MTNQISLWWKSHKISFLPHVILSKMMHCSLFPRNGDSVLSRIPYLDTSRLHDTTKLHECTRYSPRSYKRGCVFRQLWQKLDGDPNPNWNDLIWSVRLARQKTYSHLMKYERQREAGGSITNDRMDKLGTGEVCLHKSVQTTAPTFRLGGSMVHLWCIDKGITLCLCMWMSAWFFSACQS